MIDTNKEISKKLYCVQLRTGVEIWLEEDKINSIKNFLSEARSSHFLTFDNGEVINTADIAGIFSAQTMEELTRRRNGQWKCNHGYWHKRGEDCKCIGKLKKKYIDERNKALAECKICGSHGYVQGDNGMRKCNCLLTIEKKWKNVNFE